MENFHKVCEIPFESIKNNIPYFPGDENFIHMSFGYNYDQIYIPIKK